MHTSYGDMDVAIPRDRNGDYEPQLIKKYQNTCLLYTSISNSYYKYGIPVTFLTLCQNTKVKKPENYKKESVIEVYNTYDRCV